MSRGLSSEQLAWRLSGRTSWRWEPGARQVGQGFGEKMRGGLRVGKDLEGMSEPSWDGGVAQCMCVHTHTPRCPHCACAGTPVCMCASVRVIGSYMYVCMLVCLCMCVCRHVHTCACVTVHVCVCDGISVEKPGC